MAVVAAAADVRGEGVGSDRQEGRASEGGSGGGGSCIVFIRIGGGKGGGEVLIMGVGEILNFKFQNENFWWFLKVICGFDQN